MQQKSCCLASPRCAMSAFTGAMTDVAMRRCHCTRDILGPRMYVAGAYITITGGAGAMTGVHLTLNCRWTCAM